MAKQNGFDVALSEAREKLLPDEQTQTAANALLDHYRNELREIALNPNTKKARGQKLDLLDNWLFDELAQLTDTEHDEQPGQEQPGQEQPHEQPAPVEPPPPAPQSSNEPTRGKKNRKE
jgi:hypothetical protein